MKRSFFVLTVVALVALVAGFNTYMSHNNLKLSDLALANVEALAQHWETTPDNREGYVASTYQIYFPEYGYTTIPCCSYTGNEYSSCSAIDTCP